MSDTQQSWALATISFPSANSRQTDMASGDTEDDIIINIVRC